MLLGYVEIRILFLPSGTAKEEIVAVAFNTILAYSKTISPYTCLLYTSSSSWLIRNQKFWCHGSCKTDHDPLQHTTRKLMRIFLQYFLRVPDLHLQKHIDRSFSNFFAIPLIMCCIGSVSYTHLDVYKRQAIYILPDSDKHNVAYQTYTSLKYHS